MQSIMRSECPRELEPADKKTRVHVELINKREEDYSVRLCSLRFWIFVLSVSILHLHYWTPLFHVGTTEAPICIPGCRENFGWQWLSCLCCLWANFYCRCLKHCSITIIWSSCGCNFTDYLCSAEVSRWYSHGCSLQPPPYYQRYSQIHWCVKTRQCKKLPTTGNGVPSKATHRSRPDCRASWHC